MGENSLFSCLLKTKFWGGSGVFVGGTTLVGFWGWHILESKSGPPRPPKISRNQPKPAETPKGPETLSVELLGAFGGFWGWLLTPRLWGRGVGLDGIAGGFQMQMCCSRGLRKCFSSLGSSLGFWVYILYFLHFKYVYFKHKSYTRSAFFYIF